jgi:hypothetical protein
LTTHVEVVNNTLLPFKVDVLSNDESHHVGTCFPKSANTEIAMPSSVGATSGVDSKKTKSFSVPIPLLEVFSKNWESYGSGSVTLRLTPSFSDLGKDVGSTRVLEGKVDLVASLLDLKRSTKGVVCTRTEVLCRSHEELGRDCHPFALHVCLKMSLVADEHVTMAVSLDPRAVIQNKIPVPLLFKTPMPQTFSSAKHYFANNGEASYELELLDRVEVFTPGPSIAVSLRPRDSPVAGNELGWMEAGWIDLPLVPEFRLQDPIISLLPLSNKLSGESQSSNNVGAEVLVVEGRDSLESINESANPKNPKDDRPTSPRSANHSEIPKESSAAGPLTFYLTVRNYGVDHTGTILFEQAMEGPNQAMRMMSSLWQSDRNSSEYPRSSIHHSFLNEMESFGGLESSRHLSRRTEPLPLGAFSSSQQRQRISLLPTPDSAIRLLQMTMDGEDGLRRTMVRIYWFLVLILRSESPI